MIRSMTAVTVAALLVLAGAAAQGEPRQQSFALIVAHNQSLDPTVEPLRYADDDGARFYELMSSFATRVELLSLLDGETQKTFPGLAQIARRPTREELLTAVRGLRAEMRRARAGGARVAFYFYFAGHGDVGSDREGYINLLDGRFSRSDLFREIIAPSPADVNHLIIDACNSYFLVNRRGERGRRASAQEAMRSFLARESLERFPNTGVVLSTASMAESHEWSRYRSGIFSHQLLSALWGSGDVNGDGVVDYLELQAYVAAANLTVRDSRARLSIFARPPRADRSASLVSLEGLRRSGGRDPRPVPGRVAAFLELPREFVGRYYLEDDRGVRHVDFHKSGEQPLRLALLDRPYYYLRSESREALIRLGPGEPRRSAGVADSPAGSAATGDEVAERSFARVAGARLAFADLPTRGRGSVEQSFRRDLYAVPFGRSFASGHAAGLRARGEVVARDAVLLEGPVRPWYGRARTWKWVSTGVAASALTAGITFQVLAQRSMDALENGAGKITMTRAVELQDESRSRQSIAGITFGIAGTAALTAVVLFLLDGGEPAPGAQRGSSLSAQVLPGGGSLSLAGSF